MSSAIEGPNCLSICHGDCCSIKINVPKILAKEYIEKGYANKEDFIRSDIFSFQLRFDDDKGKCFLYDKKVNGCLVHTSGIKPLQCWIYPTNFSNPDLKEISCKRASGWKIIDLDKAQKAEKYLEYYVFLCKLEAKKELKNIHKRFSNSNSKKNLKELLMKTAPSRMAGFKDSWDSFSLLPAEGISLQLKKFCRELNQNCGKEFLECSSICEKMSGFLLSGFLQQNLYLFVKTNGLDTEGKYPFIKLFEFWENKISGLKKK